MGEGSFIELLKPKPGGKNPACVIILQPQLLERTVHFLEMEVERAEFLQFALLEIFRHGGVGLELFNKVRIIAAATGLTISAP
jgi:hypothetical protein